MADFFLKNYKFLGLFGLCVGLLSSCDQQKLELCKAESDHHYTNAIAELAPDLKLYQENIITIDYQRLPASAQEAKTRALTLEKHFRLSKKEREKWQAWSETELKKVQSYIDVINGHRHESAQLELVSEHLAKAANQLVAFHGFCQQSRVDRMVASLKEVESQRQSLKKLTCN